MLDVKRYPILTFDCYGTLIDWESGIFSALRPILSNHGKSVPDTAILELYGELEAEAEQGPFRPYREILQSVVGGFGRRLGFSPTEEEKKSLPDSVSSWKPFPDTVNALRELKRSHKLAIISNIDDDLFAGTAPQLEVEFDAVTTAGQARCYKPGIAIFNLALKKIGVPPSQILHCGQSIYHDVIPAQSLGIATVWVNRPSPRANVGAVKAVSGKPDLEVSDLKSLALLG